MTLTQWLLFFLVVQIIHFLGTWRLYKKAGRQPWEAAIPVYNAVVLMKIINRPWWWTILLFIPIVNLIIIPVIWVETIRSFGRNSTMETFLVIITFGLYIFYVNYALDVKYIEDRSLKPRSELGEWVSSILFAVIAATIVHTYIIQPFTIPTSSLEKTLLVGDFLFVSKFHYGARTPLTAVAFPMVHDTIPVLGVKSYLEKPQIPYFRLPGFEDIERTDIVVFNWPVDTMMNMYYTDKYYYKPIDKKTNYVKRAVGIPGDSLEIINGKIHINSQPLDLPDRAKPQFSYHGTTKGQPFDRRYLYERYEVTDPYGYNAATNTFRINLTEEAFEKFKNHPNVASIERVIDSSGTGEPGLFPVKGDHSWNRDNMGPIFIPKEGVTVPITAESIPFYQRIIEVYEGSEMNINNKISLNGTEILLNGQPLESYTFKQDYYWMMGDNRHNSLDSRYFGYVPENHVVGKPVFIWMSWDANGEGIMNKIRWERMFTTVGGSGNPISYLPYFLILVVIIIAFNFSGKEEIHKLIPNAGNFITPPYFGPVSHFKEIINSSRVWFENEDNYQKQTYRNRMYIYGANGKLSLNIPIKHLHSPGVKQHQKYKDVKIENDFNWQKQHWKSLKSAYQTSPFFEFYEDELAPIYHQEVNYLMEFNYQCFHLLCECLQLDVNFEKTSEYKKSPQPHIIDRRDLINAKTEIAIPHYTQVFEEKEGFIPNLCILDLMFNEGPNSVNFLKE